jgi:hypothetical protein
MIYTPDPQYNPVYQTQITSRTKLAPGISMAKFLGGYGDKMTMDHIASSQERLQLAKQYYLHAQVIKLIAEDKELFSDYRLIVAEGLYRPAEGETLQKNSINYFLSNGQAVVYELVDTNGENAIKKTFDLAIFLKDYVDYEKMILDYDAYDPSGSLNVQIILIMPEVRPPWVVKYDNNIETRFNNFVQSTNELIEVVKI